MIMGYIYSNHSVIDGQINYPHIMDVIIITHLPLERGHIVMLCTEHMASVGEQQQRGDHLTMTLVVRVSIYLYIYL